MAKPEETNYLQAVPDSAGTVPPPVVTASQQLPLGSLGWDNFERLCLRLAERDGEVEYAAPYGVRGQNQQGIDVLLRLSGGNYRLIQCRRIERLTPQGIAGAVHDFLQGQWADEAQEFVLATSASATRAELQDEIATQSKRLADQGVSFVVWDEDLFSRKLKEHGDLVLDFFGRAWRDAFLPELATEGFTASDRSMMTAAQALEDLSARLEATVSRQPVSNETPLVDQSFAPDTAEQLLDAALSPEVLAPDLTSVFNDLRAVSSREAAQLLAYVRDDPRRARGLIRTPQPWVEKGSAGLWNALGMLAVAAGDWRDAEQAFLRAEQRAAADERAVLLMRARDAAEADDRHEDAEAHYMRARELDPEVVAVRLAEIRQLDTPDERLGQLDALSPRNARETAAVACARVDSLVAAERLDAALAATNEILSDEPDSLVALDRRSGVAHLIATRALADGRDPDRSALRLAAEDSLRLRRLLSQRNRAAESGQLLARAAECRALASDFTDAVALVKQATEQESQHRPVRRALAQAALYARAPDVALTVLGDDDDNWDRDDRLIAARILALLDTTDAHRRVTELATPLLDDPDRREPAALAMLTAAAWDADVEWPEHAAEILAEIHPAAVAHLRAERLILEGRTDDADQLLQAHADDVDVLRALVDRALDSERWGRALTLAERLVSSTNRGEDRMRRAQALYGVGQTDKVRQELASLASDPSQPAALRKRAFGTLSAQLPGNDFAALEALTREWLQALPDDRDALWQQAFALARLARHEDALALLEEHRFEPDRSNEARLAAEIYFRALPGLEATRRIAALSDRFERSDEGLEALVLFSSARTQEEADSVLRERIADTYRTFPERFPGSKAIQAFTVPEDDPEAIVTLFEEQLARRDDSELRAAESRVGNGEGPVAVLAALAGRHITEILPLLIGLPLGYGNPELDERELEHAFAAIGGPAVWDPTSLAIVAGLPKATRELILARLPGSAVANSTLQDCDTAEGRIDDRDEQHLVGRGESGLQLTVIEGPQIDRLRAAVTGSLELARTLTPLPDSDPGEPDPLDDIVNADEVDNTAFNSWPATISAARRRGIPVYSDDRFVRVTALREKLEAFGSLAVLTALREREDLNEKQLAELRLRLLNSGALGLRPTGGELAHLARDHDWEPWGRWLNALADRLGWRNEPDARLRECLGFLSAVWKDRPDLLDVWTARVLDCAQQALDWHTHEFFARVALLYTWIGAVPAPWSERVAFGTALLRSIRAAPTHLGIAQFEYPVEHAIELALEALPSRSVRAELFRFIVRQLPFPESAEAVKAFVGR